MKAVFGYVSWYLNQFFRLNYLGYIQAIDPESLELMFKTAADKFSDLVMISVDGSTHDSNQDETLLNSVDVRVMMEFGSKLLDFLCLTPKLRTAVTNIMLQTTYSFIVRTNQMHGQIVNRGKIRGTTFTGHPTATTLGNTLRVKLYQEFIAKLANTNVVSFVAGDDVLTFIERSQVHTYSAQF